MEVDVILVWRIYVGICGIFSIELLFSDNFEVYIESVGLSRVSFLEFW